VPDLEEHYTEVVKALVAGRVTPLLGAGVNLVKGPQDEAPRTGRLLPSSRELAEELAREFRYPTAPGERLDLLRISQYACVAQGSGPLYIKLRSVFDSEYPPTKVHSFFAKLPSLLRSQGRASNQLLITTNYDDALECAFRAAGEPYDLVWYMADGEQKGFFWQWPNDGEPQPILDPGTCVELSTERRTVILKIHGTIDRQERERDSYVITEDHYIDYLTRTETSRVPVKLAETLKWTHLLFLGYSLSDWNLRVFMHRIWEEQKLRFDSWSIQADAAEIDKRFWERRGVEILNIPLEQYVDELEARLERALATAPAPA
jgi:hypothetical protein